MTASAHIALRQALTELASRRTVIGASLLGMVGFMPHTRDVDAKNKKRRKRCKGGAQRCGKGCCKAPSICSANSCFCTGSEGNCRSVPQDLIDLIAEALGIPPGQIAADPGKPLACDTIPLPTKEQIDIEIVKGFGVPQPVPWCDSVNAGAGGILEQLKQTKG